MDTLYVKDANYLDDPMKAAVTDVPCASDTQTNYTMDLELRAVQIPGLMFSAKQFYMFLSKHM